MPHNDLHPKEIRNNTNTRSGEKNPPTTKRNGVDKNDALLRYPYAMLNDNTDYLRIRIAKYKSPELNLNEVVTKTQLIKDGKETTETTETINEGFSLKTGTSSNQSSLKDPKHTIYLPIPQQLSDNTSVSWGDSTLSAIEAFGVAATSNVLENGLEGALETFTQIGNIPKLIGNNEQMRQALIASISGKAVGTIGGNVSGSQLISRATGQVFNPNLELLFEGVNIRTFPFSFEFFPRNLKEADQVKRIIRTLKKSMSARKTGTSGIFISAPDVFELTYMKGNKKHPFLNTFLPMALTSVNVVYTGSNTYSTFHDGTPTHMRMDLTFKELNPVYFEDYQDLENKGDLSVGY